MAEMQVELRFRDIICRKTTDIGHDEFYAVISGIDSKGEGFSFLFPDPQSSNRDCGDADNRTALDFNDSGDKQAKTLLRYPLIAFPFEEGDIGNKAKIVFTFWERDGQDYSSIVDAVGKLGSVAGALLSGDPSMGGSIARLIDGLKGVLPDNRDDFLGAYSIEMTWDSVEDTETTNIIWPPNNQPTSTTEKVGTGNQDRLHEPGRLGPEWEYFTMILSGDGSTYEVQTYLHMVKVE